MFSAKVNDFLESRTPSGGPPSDLEWQGFPTPQPGKTKYSSLSQISLRINKKSNVTLLVPRSPPGHLAKHPLSPNIGMDIEPRTRIIHHSYHSVNSNIRPDLNPPCHNHYIDIFPCEEQSCASLEKFLHELWSHTWCTESSLWKLNVCLLRDNFCLNFKTQPLQVYFPM